MPNVIEKGFLQTIINNGCLTKDNAVEIVHLLCEKNGISTIPSLEDLLKSINGDISQFGQCITIFKHPIAKENFVVFVLTFESSFEHFPTYMNETDCKYFSKLVSTIVKDDNYSMHWAKVFQIADSLAQHPKKLSKSNVQELFDLWSSQGYFFTKDEVVYLGPRLIVEFENYLKMHYEEHVKDCPLCGKLVLWDIKCGSCQVRFHRDCIRKYLRLKSNCPSCKKLWNTRISL